MSKKMYFEPEMEELLVETLGMLCISGDDEGDEVNTGGGENEETPGGW